MNEDVIYYSQCWEDPSVVLRALLISSSDNVLSITSGGDNSLAMLCAGASQVVSIDINPAQNYLCELKFKAAKLLSYDEYLEFLGIRNSENRASFFEKIKPTLSNPAQVWWLEHEDLILNGVNHCGKFDTYIRFFARKILPYIHSKQIVLNFLATKSLEEQWKFYTKVWNSFLWKFMFRFATKRQLLTRARHSRMFAQTDEKTKTLEYVRRLEKNIATVPIHDNYFMHYSLNGNYAAVLPFLAQEENFNKLKAVNEGEESGILYVSQNLLTYLRTVPDNSFSKYNLSDIFEALSLEENDKIWNEIVRTAKSGARVVYWNNLVKRTYPFHLSKMIRSDEIFQDELRKQDRVYFYDKVYTHTIIK
jgi:S-adenosylmethionine-diacylglycerol 3-amino-3-carboxypropyl transferase